MARLNAKTAKALRKAAEYNPTTKRDKPPFPGIAYLVAFPVFETQNGRHVPKLKANGEPETYPVPVTKPAKYDSTTSKGVYRQLKRAARSGVLSKYAAILES